MSTSKKTESNQGASCAHWLNSMVLRDIAAWLLACLFSYGLLSGMGMEMNSLYQWILCVGFGASIAGMSKIFNS